VDQVDAMKRLVNEFRDYARLPTAELKPLDLNALVQDVMGLYAQDVGQGRQQATIELQLDPQCPLIDGDAQQLRQVVHNLLQNAQDACEAAGHSDAKVQVVTSFNAERGRVRLRVRDAGKGFPAAILQRAFEPYVTTKAKGTGLGLAVVKKIADEHGAKIELSNLQEQGETIGAQVSLSFKVNRDNA
jgi:nitrogen fixation/metabolism regulation signal transduction histidine kinase